MSAGIPDAKILRDAKRALTARIIPRARHWSEIVRGEWWSILLATGARIGRDNVSILAAGVAFYIFVAIPSSLTAVVSIYGLMFNPLAVENQIRSMIGLLPDDVIDIVTNFLRLLADQAAIGAGPALDPRPWGGDLERAIRRVRHDLRARCGL